MRLDQCCMTFSRSLLASVKRLNPKVRCSIEGYIGFIINKRWPITLLIFYFSKWSWDQRGLRGWNPLPVLQGRNPARWPITLLIFYFSKWSWDQRGLREWNPLPVLQGRNPARWSITSLIALFPSHGAFGPGFGKSPRGKNQ